MPPSKALFDAAPTESHSANPGKTAAISKTESSGLPLLTSQQPLSVSTCGTGGGTMSGGGKLMNNIGAAAGGDTNQFNTMETTTGSSGNVMLGNGDNGLTATPTTALINWSAKDTWSSSSARHQSNNTTRTHPSELLVPQQEPTIGAVWQLLEARAAKLPTSVPAPQQWNLKGANAAEAEDGNILQPATRSHPPTILWDSPVTNEWCSRISPAAVTVASAF